MPYERVILGPKYAIRLEDLTAADVFVVTCLRCGRLWRVAPHHLHLRFPPQTQLIWAERRLRCRRCGAGDGLMSWHVERARPDGPYDVPTAAPVPRAPRAG